VIEISDAAPAIDVQQAEFTRLLGYPRGWVLSGRANELAAWAREWYARHGRPWVYAREARALHVNDAAIEIEGVAFSSARLRNTLQAAGAHGAILVAASAGQELENEAQARWRDEKPDEYFFLEVYGSAVVEHLVTMTGARLCAHADADGVAVLPHYSPGYPEWTIREQPDLLALVRHGKPDAVPLEVLDSGMLRPKKSLLAVFGLTRHTERVRPLSGLSPCENCSFVPCQYRRSAYRRTPRPADPDLREMSGAPAADDLPLALNATYSVGVKALARWSTERLSIAVRDDGSIDALFRYDGTTCMNMGRPLRFHYHVTLGSRQDGYPIREQSCGPAPGDEGHTSMCRYLSDGKEWMASIASERPLLGEPLDAVVRWARPASPAGCYCEAESRQHKWGLVLETIHYTLAHRPEQVTAQNQSQTERS
jgi:hypothetical protein